MPKLLTNNILYIAWFQALISTLGSLYFSEVMHLPPCSLCWYQRAMMYPLVLVLGVGILRKDKQSLSADKNVYFYALPLSLIGLIIALYHNLLYYNIIPESAAPCVAGISCTTKLIEWFGFITIPLLSLASFAIITASLIIYRRFSN